MSFILTLSVDKICEILSADDLRCNEDFIFDIALHYCTNMHPEANEESSKVIPPLKTEGLNLQEVMKCVRLSYLSKNYLAGKADTKYVCPEYYKTALKNKIHPRGATKEKKRDFQMTKFYIGKFGEKYIGKRVVNSKECESDMFRILIAESYMTNNGFPSLDDFVGDVLCNETEVFQIGIYDECWLGSNSKKIQKYETVTFGRRGSQLDLYQLSADDFLVLHSWDSMNKVTRKDLRVGLFVSNGTKFD